MNPRLAVVGFAAFALLLGACASGPAPVDHYYRLEIAGPSAAGGPSLTGTLFVDPFRTDGLTGQRNLLYQQSGDSAEVRQHSYHRWTDPPAIALQTALVRFLREGGAAPIVMEANARTRAEHTVTGRIHRLEQSVGDVIVEIDLTLTRSDGEILVHQNYSETRPAAGIAEAAGAIGDAVHGIFERFLVDLRRRA